MYTPAQSRHTRTLSPPLSTTGSSQFTTTQQPKLNVVTRLAIEGKARQGHDGAGIKMYLKLSIPMDNVSPGSTIPLFPEENLKLLSAQVHPIDHNSVPYNFSSATFPMLNNAARALNLPARSQKSYMSVFGLPTPASSTMHSNRTPTSTASSSATNVSPVDERYIGHIIVSGYNISYILPKDFPPRFGSDDSAMRVSTFSATKMRRGSISERNNMHFMAAVDLWVPYISRPPRAPFLISIPVPRCLSNNIKLRIYPPATASTSSSLASLSSAEEDPGAWELASEPHVTRTTSRPSRSGSYADMADDESSDSSAYADGSSGGIAIQGTFPSAERLRVRWAQPTKTVASTGDGRRRVGVKEAKGEMTTAVLGKARDPSSDREGVLMRVEYKGTCKGVWFPGVATMLGMDVGLEAKGSDVVWAPAEEAKWTVTGGTGYTGFDVGPPSTPVSRQPSLEFPVGMATSSMLHAPAMATRHDSSSSTSSLLRAPLPADHLPDYSFEGSPTSLTPSGTLSSISSIPLTSEERSRASSDAITPPPRPPALPITIHINMNDIIPPSKNVFTFTITGTILVISRPRPHLTNGHATHSGSGSDGESDPVPVVLPRFSVLAADSETTATIIRNESDGATVEVYNISGDLRDAQTRRTVLQRSGMTRCGSDGGRIALRSISRLAIPKRVTAATGASDSRISPRLDPLSGNRSALSPLSIMPANGGLTRRRRNGALMIPSVDVAVTPMLLGCVKYSNAHAVRVRLHAPCDANSEWLEFGLARAGSAASLGPSSDNDERQPQIEIVNASVDGVPVRFESSALDKQDQSNMIDLGASFDEKTRSDWITWVKIHVGDQGGQVAVDYIVKESDSQNTSKDLKRKGRAKDQPALHFLLPTFALPVGRLEVTVETSRMSLRSNFAHQQQSPRGHRLLHYSLDEFFTPRMSLEIEPNRSNIRMGCTQLGKFFLLLLCILPAVLVLMLLVNLGTEFKHMRQSLDQCSSLLSLDRDQIPEPSTETVFVTTTIFAPMQSSRAFGDTSITPATTASLTSVISVMPTPSSNPSPPSPRSQSVERSGADTTTFTPAPTPSSSPHLSENSLLPIPAFPFEWSALQIELSPAARTTVDTVLGGLGAVWQVFRKVYHYPLDPP
ncbi:hypothetical protein HYDPIDRAFT_24029 [Hydnomerulius pinastri MD-312]|nr:hypothetical protein HYDPIDRAFT_24029 [Hydnomerulius pinastri MD-312]